MRSLISFPFFKYHLLLYSQSEYVDATVSNSITYLSGSYISNTISDGLHPKVDCKCVFSALSVGTDILPLVAPSTVSKYTSVVISAWYVCVLNRWCRVRFGCVVLRIQTDTFKKISFFKWNKRMSRFVNYGLTLLWRIIHTNGIRLHYLQQIKDSLQIVV